MAAHQNRNSLTTNGNPAVSTESSAVRPQGMARRWVFLIVATAFLFVLMPFLFWESTWFGRPLTDAQIDNNLADVAHPRKAQHALSQIADRILSREPAVRDSARKWYPKVAEFSTSGVDELRLTSAWVMGQDNSVPEFHAALLQLLKDANPMVRRNAALSLVRFGRDASGHGVIVEMLSVSTVRAPHAGALSQRLKPGDTVNPGTLLGRLEAGGTRTEIRSQVPGTVARWIAQDGAAVNTGDPLLSLSPSTEEVWEALRALYVIGKLEDLPSVERYSRGVPDMPDTIRRQAIETARAVRVRPGQ
jgi:biotin carboxyl carrier protein